MPPRPHSRTPAATVALRGRAAAALSVSRRQLRAVGVLLQLLAVCIALGCGRVPVALADQGEPLEQRLPTHHDESVAPYHPLGSGRRDGAVGERPVETTRSAGGTGVLIVASIDGSLTGLDRGTGAHLWRRDAARDDVERSGSDATDATGSHHPHTSLSSRSLLAPLVATTTTTRSSVVPSDATAASFDHTLAVPWTDGRVSLTARDVTVTTRVSDLVDRAPFVDARGRLYTAQRQATAFAIDTANGRILQVEPVAVDTERHGSVLWQTHTMDEPYTGATADEPGNKEVESPIVWLGRVDESVSLYEPRSGELDAQVTTARLMGMQDMLLGDGGHRDAPWVPRQFHSPPKGPVGHLDAVLFTTPNGHVALADAASGRVRWLVRHCVEAPVAYAIDAESGASLTIHMVQDAAVPDGTNEYLTRDLEQQIQRLMESMGVEENRAAEARPRDEQSIVGTMANGQLYAVHLGLQQTEMYPSIPLAADGHSKSFHVASGVSSYSNPTQPTTQHHSRVVDYHRRRDCRAGNVNFPGCLSGSFQPSGYGRMDDSFLTEVDGDGGMVAYYNGDSVYPEHYFTLPHYDDQRSRERRRYRRLLRLMGSWLPPFITLIFVVSFEMGRRKRQKATQGVDSQIPMVEQATNVGLIKVFDDSILGYGGHGTVVYKGSLEDRLVAVKKMLRAYHASADREISLLIESDGHPNVVRYFLKEVRGDFVYLALELCDLSLHDLISILQMKYDQIGGDSEFLATTVDATKLILSQIASGVQHLHGLRIVHRDLKPQNILLAATKKSKDDDSDAFQHFLRHEYVAKISDMGLGKQLLGQSSFGASLIGESIRGQSNGAQSSVAGVGPGSVGWQAPEVMNMRMPSDASARSEGSGPIRSESNSDSNSPVEAAINARTSRSVDIFSLGCIFYSTMVPGSHPFGEWYEREANIMHNRPDIDALKERSFDAYDLVRAMIQRNPLLRPSSKQVCAHPFFWQDEKRIGFLCDFSDRIESDSTCDGEMTQTLSMSLVLAVEKKAADVVGLAWDVNLDTALVNNVVRFRTYDPSSVRDLLRLIRNKCHHFDELPFDLKNRIGNTISGLLRYFEQRFPSLVIHCFNVCSNCLPDEDPLCERYNISPIGRLFPSRPIIQTPTIIENTDTEDDAHDGDILPLNGFVQLRLNTNDSDRPKVDTTTDEIGQTASQVATKAATLSMLDDPSVRLFAEHANIKADEVGDIIIWEASTASKTFNCRGWSRSDDEWERRVVDLSIRRRDNKDLIRCSEDPRFRTRLCNHWSASYGCHCPMRTKRKCIFAHGPVELRVKEGKRNRWGKLVDINGDNSNRAHSGGEDTYGIAKSIEAERTSQGKGPLDGGGRSSTKKSQTSSTKKKKANKPGE